MSYLASQLKAKSFPTPKVETLPVQRYLPVMLQAWWILPKRAYAKELKIATYNIRDIKEHLRENLQDRQDPSEFGEPGEGHHVGGGDFIDEVREWSDSRKEDVILVHSLRSTTKEALIELEKREIHGDRIEQGKRQARK